MENLCVFCGEKLNEGMSPIEHHEFKKMCLNCTCCKLEDENYFCENEDNKTTVLNKMKEAASAVTESYKLVNMDIAPLPLKKPTSKCKHWQLNDDVRSKLEELFK
jgi:hypothetical protein